MGIISEPTVKVSASVTGKNRTKRFYRTEELTISLRRGVEPWVEAHDDVPAQSRVFYWVVDGRLYEGGYFAPNVVVTKSIRYLEPLPKGE